MDAITIKLKPDIEGKMRVLFRELQELGILHIGHGIIRRGCVPTAIYSHKEWGEKYVGEGYYKVDPLRFYAIHTSFKCISWDSLVIEDKKENEAISERKKMCSVKNGILITVRTPEQIETFALGTDSKRICMTSLISNPSIKNYLGKISETHKMHY